MINNSAKVRIQLKKDTEKHWNLARNFIPLAGEPIIYTVDENHTAPRVKIGDGQTYVVDLPFITATPLKNSYIASGTPEYWATQREYIPPQNMILVYWYETEGETEGEFISYPRIKIGDGNSYCIDLPFVGDETLDLLNKHIHDTTVHVTSEEKDFWNNKINTENFILNENLILTRN